MIKPCLTPPFSLSSLESTRKEICLASTLYRKHNIHFTKNIFDLENPTLSELLERKSALFAVSKTVYQLYGDKISEFLKKANFKSKIVFVPTGEDSKNLEAAMMLCQEANNFNLNRDHPIISIGGGICLDICGLAAALFRRGVPHIKIPTTFVGLIDAGIATKNGVNLGMKKNLLGTFYPPEATIIDSTFLKTLSLNHIACGTAESIKMALISDHHLYKLWLNHGQELQESLLQEPEKIAQEVIHLSINGMLQELSTNLYEHNCYQRSVDFGHSFSQHIEQVSAYQIPHGQAVAIDMAICCQISNIIGLLSDYDLQEVLSLFKSLNLSCYDSCINLEELWLSLSSVIAHRGGDLNLVLPKGIGQCHFLEKLSDLPKAYLKEALQRLRNYHAQNGRNPVVSQLLARA